MANKDIYNLFDIINNLKSKGRRGDTELAHVTPEEKRMLEARGGAGTINPQTGLREYHYVAPGTILDGGEQYESRSSTGIDSNQIDMNDHYHQNNFIYSGSGHRIGDAEGINALLYSQYGDNVFTQNMTDQMNNPWEGHTQGDEQENMFYQSPEMIAEEEANRAKTEEEEIAEAKIGAAEGAGFIEYKDYSKFLDPLTGEVSDLEGMKEYLKNMEELKSLGYTEDKDIYELMQGMPSLAPPKGDLSQMKSTHQSALNTYSTDIESASRKAISQRVSSGVKSPTSSGQMGYLSEDYMEPYYAQGQSLARAKSDVYGLGTKSEEDLLSWASSRPDIS